MEERKNLVSRRRCGRGYSYHYLKDEKTLKDTKKKEWIKSLVIPPAWKNVRIDLNKNAKIHAWGRDTKGRKQYIYSEKWIKRREKEKFNHIIDFAEQLPEMRKITSKHLKLPGIRKEKVLACMTRLIDNAYFRPGNKYYSDENNSYGLTTLRSRHLEIKGSTLEFEYKGKSGKVQNKEVEDERLAKIVKSIDSLPGYRIFKYPDENGNLKRVNAQELNDYISSIMGEGFTAKDFRTWAGTYLASELLSKLEVEEEETAMQKRLIEVIDSVAKRLGNTRSIAKANYIDPRVIDHFSKGVTIKNYIKEVEKELRSDSMMSIEELALIKLLKQ